MRTEKRTERGTVVDWSLGLEGGPKWTEDGFSLKAIQNPDLQSISVHPPDPIFSPLRSARRNTNSARKSARKGLPEPHIHHLHMTDTPTPLLQPYTLLSPLSSSLHTPPAPMHLSSQSLPPVTPMAETDTHFSGT